MRLDHDWIAAHIPHQGSMCLLDAVLEWDPQQLRARAHSHRALDNPLRSHGRLGAVCGVEYAAQAVAVHSALLQAQTPVDPFGMLASARAVQLAVARLDDIEHELSIVVRRLQSNQHSALYEFALRDPVRELLSGRLSLLLSAAAIVGPTGAGSDA